MKAMIFAAGLGTRLRPLTNNKPKALVKVNGTTLLEHTIQRLKRFGYTEIVVNVHHFAEQIISFFQEKNNFNLNIHISDERGLLLETGGGLQKAAPFFQTSPLPFLVTNVDLATDIDLHQMLTFHQQGKALATLAVRKRQSSRYLLFDKNNRLCGWKNVKTGEVKLPVPNAPLIELGFSGIHIIDPIIFNHIQQTGRFSIITTYLDLAAKHTLQGFRHDDSIWLDVGKHEALKVAERLLL